MLLKTTHRSIGVTAISIAVGLIFILAGILKLCSEESFEMALAAYAHLGWTTAAIVARALPGLEIGTGLLLACSILGKNNIVPKIAMLGTISLSGYVIYLLVRFGNTANCQCFGDSVFISPTNSLIKNALIISALVPVSKYGKGWHFRFSKVAIGSGFLVSAVLPIIIIPLAATQPIANPNYPRPIDLNPLYSAQNKVTPVVRLDSGHHILAFLNPNCSHCRMAARKMQIMKTRDTALPFFLVIGGTESDLTQFWKETQAQNLPYSRLAAQDFMNYTHGRFPMLLGIHNGIAEMEPEYNTLTENILEQWLRR